MISYLGFPLQWPDGETFGTICVLDSKARKYSDDYIELLREFKLLLEADLERELRQKDLLEAENLTALKLRKVHHRIKNQFNLISSFVQLKSSESKEKDGSVLDEIDGMIRSTALLHSKIYKSKDFNTSMVEYIEDVIKAALSSYKINIELDFNAETEMNYDSNKMFEFGIIFIELVTNSIKSGLSSETGKISVSIKNDENNSNYIIIFKDNGSGFPEEVLKDYGNKGLGTLIIEGFTSNLNGTIRRYNDEGAVVKFILPKISKQ